MKKSLLAPLPRLLAGLLTLLLTTLTPLAGAYTHMGTNVPINDGLLYWDGATMTYQFWSGVSDALPNMVPGSDPAAAVDQAFRIWQDACGFTFTRGEDTPAQTVNGYDDLNLVTFADTATNRAILGGTTGKAIITFDFYNEIHDIDIAFHPDAVYTTLKTSGDPKQSIARPLLPCALKQAGSCLSLMASPIQSSAVMRYVGGRLASTEAGRLGTFLTLDDLIGANIAYPRPGFFDGTGAISGLVTLAGQRVYGAHVVAVEQATGRVMAGNVTLGDNQDDLFGRYTIQGLPPGRYTVYAEPADAPYMASNWEGTYSLGDYWGKSFTPGYQTTFHGSASAPTAVQVTAGATATINIAMTAGDPAIVPIYDGLLPAGLAPDGADAQTSGVLNPALAVHTPLVLAPGERRTIVLAGPGLAAAAGITSSDPALTVDLSRRYNGHLSDGSDFILCEIAAPESTIEGPRNLVFRRGAEVAVMTGALYIDPLKYGPRNSAGAGWTKYR